MIDVSKTHSLGQRAFFLFLAKRLKEILVIGIIAGLIWYAKGYAPESYEIWVDYGARLIALLATGYVVFILCITYLAYRRYTYRFTDEAFIMTQGYIVHNEVAAVYHQIQSVNIKRTPLDRLVGVGQVVIMLTGADRDPEHSQIVLPGVGKAKSKLVQKELLMRARKHAMLQVSGSEEE